MQWLLLLLGEEERTRPKFCANPNTQNLQQKLPHKRYRCCAVRKQKMWVLFDFKQMKEMIMKVGY
jgi:hypothetical protein